MTNRLMASIAAAALTAVGAIAAQAADLPTRKEAPAPVFVPPPFTWTGFYVGLNAGGIWGTGGTQTTLYNAGFPLLTTYWPNGSLGGGQSGFIGGGQAGYNWQTGMFVLGVETDFDWTSLNKNSNFIGSTFPLERPERLADGERFAEAGLAGHDARPCRLRRHARQSADVLRHGRLRLRRRQPPLRRP